MNTVDQRIKLIMGEQIAQIVVLEEELKLRTERVAALEAQLKAANDSIESFITRTPTGAVEHQPAAPETPAT